MVDAVDGKIDLPERNNLLRGRRRRRATGIAPAPPCPRSASSPAGRPPSPERSRKFECMNETNIGGLRI